MSLDAIHCDSYYLPGYVYIAGSLSGRLIKIGTTVNIRRRRKELQNPGYGGFDDWVILYYVWVDEAIRIEYAALWRLRRYKLPKIFQRKGREIVQCSFSMAQKTLSDFISGEERCRARWSSRSRSNNYEFWCR
jgi:hypothetical protein